MQFSFDTDVGVCHSHAARNSSLVMIQKLPPDIWLLLHVYLSKQDIRALRLSTRLLTGFPAVVHDSQALKDYTAALNQFYRFTEWENVSNPARKFLRTVTHPKVDPFKDYSMILHWSLFFGLHDFIIMLVDHPRFTEHQCDQEFIEHLKATVKRGADSGRYWNDQFVQMVYRMAKLKDDQ